MKNFKTLFNAIQDFSTWFNSNPFGIIKQVWKEDYEYYFEEYYNYLNQFCVYQFKKDQQLLLEEFLKENKNYSFDVLQNAMDILSSMLKRKVTLKETLSNLKKTSASGFKSAFPEVKDLDLIISAKAMKNYIQYLNKKYEYIPKLLQNYILNKINNKNEKKINYSTDRFFFSGKCPKKENKKRD